MEKKRQIDCFLPYGTASMVDSLIAQLSKERVVKDIYVLAAEGMSVDTLPQRTQLLQTDSLLSSATMRLITAQATAEYALLYLKQSPLTLGYQAIERMLQVAEATNATLVYG